MRFLHRIAAWFCALWTAFAGLIGTDFAVLCIAPDGCVAYEIIGMDPCADCGDLPAGARGAADPGEGSCGLLGDCPCIDIPVLDGAVRPRAPEPLEVPGEAVATPASAASGRSAAAAPAPRALPKALPAQPSHSAATAHVDSTLLLI